jgi:hypothetical protein
VITNLWHAIPSPLKWFAAGMLAGHLLGTLGAIYTIWSMIAVLRIR